MPAMVVNDNAYNQVKRGALESIAGKPAPTGIVLPVPGYIPLVGAGLPAMVVNDNACGLVKRGALESIASRLAPTGIALPVFPSPYQSDTRALMYPVQSRRRYQNPGFH